MPLSLASLGVNPDRLYHGQPPVAGATLYTAPGTTGGTRRTKLGGIVIANPSPAEIAVRLGLVPQGGTEDNTHYLLGGQKIPANQTFIGDLETWMRPGDLLVGASDSLPPPVGLAGTPSASGGTLAAATYYYKLTATTANGETLTGAEIPVTTTGSTGSVALSWPRALGATGYKLYRSTGAPGGNQLLATISGGGTLTYSDTGSVAPSGAAPGSPTAAGCIFTVSGVELPA